MLTVIGGYSTSSVEVLVSAENTREWNRTLIPEVGGSNLYYHTALVVQNTLYVFGGKGKGGKVWHLVTSYRTLRNRKIEQTPEWIEQTPLRNRMSNDRHHFRSIQHYGNQISHYYSVTSKDNKNNQQRLVVTYYEAFRFVGNLEFRTFA